MTETRVPWHPAPLDDDELNRLIRCAEKNGPAAALEIQSGAYACSTENVDELVDLCDSVEGCLGSQILGAGMGGCIMALVKSEAEELVTQKLLTDYYEPRELPGDVWSVIPGEGASVERIL
jgi:mevalonate kinase